MKTMGDAMIIKNFITMTVFLVILSLTTIIGQQQQPPGSTGSPTNGATQTTVDSVKVPPILKNIARHTKEIFVGDSLFEYEKQKPK